MFFLLSSKSCILLLLTSSILSTSAQNSYAPVQWTPEVVQSEQCGLGITSDLSDAIATVAQLIKSNDCLLPSQVLHGDKGELSSQSIWILHN